MKNFKQKMAVMLVVAVTAWTMCFAAPIEAAAAQTRGADMHKTAEQQESGITNFQAKAVAYNKIQLSWTDQGIDNEGYEIYRATSKAGTYQKVKQIDTWVDNTWNDTNIKSGVRYYYKIRGIRQVPDPVLDENGNVIDFKYVTIYGDFSKVVSAAAELAAPVLSVKAVSASKVKLTWKIVDGAFGYKIYKYSSSKKAYSEEKTIKKGKTASWVNKNLKSGTTVKYKMRAYAKANGKTIYSGYSAIKSVTLKSAKKPSKPKTDKKPENSKGGTVYITDTGLKYHRGSCRYLKKSKIKISRSDAIARGYKACKVCKP